MLRFLTAFCVLLAPAWSQADHLAFHPFLCTFDRMECGADLDGDGTGDDCVHTKYGLSQADHAGGEVDPFLDLKIRRGDPSMGDDLLAPVASYGAAALGSSSWR